MLLWSPNMGVAAGSRGKLICIGLVTWLGFAASSAAAQTPGLHVDPDSPGGKEYAIPLDQARGQGATGTPQDSTGSTPAKLFGEGIEPAGSDAGGGSHSGNGRSGPAKSTGGSSDSGRTSR